MTQVVVMQRQIPEQTSVLEGNEFKNLLLGSKLSWEDFAGLSWIFFDDFEEAKPTIKEGVPN